MKERGEAVAIRPTAAADLPDLMALWNDGRIMRWVGFPAGLGHDERSIAKWFDGISGNPRRRHFVVTSSLLGFCGEAYYAVDPDHRRAGLDIKLRVEAHGGGRAAGALLALIHRVFETEPGVDSVWTEPLESNLAARTLYWQCGLRTADRPSDMEPGPSYWELRREHAVRI